MAAKLIDLSFTLNGRKVKVQIAPDTMLFALLREQGCASVRCACETTNCGLCTVWLDGDPVLSCSVPAARVEGRSITTLEGLKTESEALARAMAAEGAEQCGFCAPGLIMNVLALARAAKEDPSLVATREELSRQLAGNLCRCSGYESQLRAIVRFLNSRGVIRSETAPGHASSIITNADMTSVSATSAGLLRRVKFAGAHVRRGEQLAFIINPCDGSVREVLKAPVTGMLFFMQDGPFITEHSPVFQVLAGA